MFAPKNILVPSDFSVYSDNALKKAVDIAVQHKAKIYLLHVVEIALYAFDYCYESDLIEQAEGQSIKFAEEKLRKEVESIGVSKNVDIVFDIKKGDPAKNILEEEKDKEIDLIVIASHGRKGMIHLLGSVSERVLRSAKGSVLLVR